MSETPTVVRADGRVGPSRVGRSVVVAMVVVAACVIVVVLAVRAVGNGSQSMACATDLRTVKSAVEAYRAEHGFYPGDEAALVPGFLRRESSLYNYVLTDGTAAYVPVAPCTE
ncbi:MAG: hypothetical protein R2754_06955 [Microthrixaceae bacterium]